MTGTMDLLLVEDDELLGDGVQTVLQRRGLGIDWVRDGISAIQSMKSYRYDLLLLDLNIPWLSGLEVLARLRDEGNRIPVLILTARSEVVDRVEALDCGADDYMVTGLQVGAKHCLEIEQQLRIKGFDGVSPVQPEGKAMK